MQTALFLLAFVLAGTAALTLVRSAEFRAAHAEIEELEDDASDLIEQGRTAELIRKINGAQREPSRLYRLQDAAGRLLGGRLPEPPAGGRLTLAKYWTVFHAQGLTAPHGASARVLVLVHPEPGDLRLAVGEDLSLRERKDTPQLALAFAAAALVSGLGMAGGFAVAGRTVRRADRLGQAVAAFAGGERQTRVPVDRGASSELDELAVALNDMMDREARLVEGLRQTSSAIAHDLRRPLAEHNRMIAEALRTAPCEGLLREALVQASARIEEVLATFQSLLHIAELEAGAPGLTTEPVDLNAIAERVADAYRPHAEDGGRTIAFSPALAPQPIQGEARALTRMLANMVENAITHTPAGTRVEVNVGRDGWLVSVRDDGPGVPDTMLERIFERFVRLDLSRGAGGAGLGLALAAATARAFGATVRAENAKPGLRVVIDFTEGRSTRSSSDHLQASKTSTAPADRPSKPARLSLSP